MQNSEQKQYSDLFEEEKDGGGGGGGRSRGRKRTVGIEFKNALGTLMKDLRRTEPHYVRCFKPNELRSNKHFNGESIMRQLKCSGVLETIRIRSGGYPNRRPYKDFIQRYLVLAPDCNRNGGDRAVIANICDLLGIEKSEYAFGMYAP